MSCWVRPAGGACPDPRTDYEADRGVAAPWIAQRGVAFLTDT